jgi:hypothetical protein
MLALKELERAKHLVGEEARVDARVVAMGIPGEGR